MKKSPVTFLLWGLLLLVGGVAQAQLQDVAITAARQRLSQGTSRPGGNLTVTTQEIIYNVTVENKTFKPITNLQVKYMIFYKDPHAGSTTKAVNLSFNGEETLPLVEANRTATFATKSMKLKSESLDGGYFYENGGASNASDKVVGLWFRAYANGKMVGEYANPTNIAKSEDWKESSSPSPDGQ